MQSANSPKKLPLTHERIRAQLLMRLGTDWPAGSRIPTMRQLAAELDVGYRNLCRAARDLADQGFLASRPGLGTFVTRVPHHARPGPADAAHSRRSQGPGERRLRVLHGTGDSFLLPAVQAVCDAIAPLGRVSVEAITCHDTLAGRLSDAHGAILVNPNNGPARDIPDDLPCVVISTSAYLPLDPTASADLVTVDDRQGAFLAGFYAKQLGLQHACFLGCWEEGAIHGSGIAADRLAGFEQGLGRPVNQALRLRATDWSTMSGARLAAAAMRLHPRPDVFFCASDDLAIGFMHGAAALHCRPRMDYQLIGFDGQHRGRTITDGPLTTIDVPMAEMGAHAARLLAERLACPTLPRRQVSLSCTLFEGATTGTP